ncbi:uncharacterized protein si:dkey-9i23.6 isoform X2 [Pseudorasbora parva]|uniref:uncharacterized protein si:dkey-9i23.6 isoform X2 n=1 Tax=Pseudorasbora parva TaxID=51549 RepID=UPI00351F2C05
MRDYGGTNSKESKEHIAKEDGNDLDSTVRSDGDEAQPTRSSKPEDGNEAVEEFRGPPDMFNKSENKSFPPVSLSIQTQAADSSPGPKEGELSSENKKENNQEPSVEEHTAGAPSLLNNPSQQSSAHTSHLSMSSERCDTTQMELKHEQLDDSTLKPVGMDTNSVLTHQTAVNLTSRTARSSSDPVAQKRKEERPLSAPSISNPQECENMANTMKRFSKAALVLGWEDSNMSFGGMEQANSLPKMQKKGVKNKMKNLTHKLMEKLKEKQYLEDDSKSIQDSGEEAAKCLNSMEMEMEMEVEAPDIPPPLPPKKGKYVFLARTFTLKDFKLNLEPINLMEEIFTGNEWLNYLPSKTGPVENDTSDQPMAYDVLQKEQDTQLNIPRLTPQLDQSEVSKNDQDHVSDAQQDNVAKVNSDLQVKQDSNTFAIPKAMLANNAIKQMVSGIDCKSKKDDIYDCLDMYIIPKNDLQLKKRKSLDAPLMDFSAIKSFELLDNSALKSRIRLSKKRPHKPPKKVKKEKSNTIFYNIPGHILNESLVSGSLPFTSIPFSKSPPHHSPLFPDHT